MRYIIALWALPLVIFWGWFGLSYFDMNFGYVMLTRQVHYSRQHADSYVRVEFMHSRFDHSPTTCTCSPQKPPNCPENPSHPAIPVHFSCAAAKAGRFD